MNKNIVLYSDKLLDDAGNKITGARYRLSLLADGSMRAEILRFDAKGDHSWDDGVMRQEVLSYVCQRFAAILRCDLPSTLWSGRLLRKMRVVLVNEGRDGQVPPHGEVAVEHVVVDATGVERWVDAPGYDKHNLVVREAALEAAVLALANRAGLL